MKSYKYLLLRCHHSVREQSWCLFFNEKFVTQNHLSSLPFNLIHPSNIYEALRVTETYLTCELH